MSIFIQYSDQVTVFSYLIVPFSTLWRGGGANFSYFGETRLNTHGDNQSSSVCARISREPQSQLIKSDPSDLAVTVSAVIAQEYVFQESQVI